MTPERFHLLLEGVTKIWQLDVNLECNPGKFECHIQAEGIELMFVRFVDHSFGSVWEIFVPGRRKYVHPSVGAALQNMRKLLCPDRPIGRVVFLQ